MLVEYGDIMDAMVIIRKLRLRILRGVISQQDDLTTGDLSVFNKVCKGDGNLTMSNISEQTGFSNAMITASVDSLEEKGLVSRRKGDDRRTYFIDPTGNGMSRFREILRVQVQVMENIFGGMTRDQQEKLSHALRDLNGILGGFL